MTELQRLVLDFRTEKLVARYPYRSKGDSNPGTKGRTKEVANLTRTGLEQALDALEGGAECVGTSGFTTREDVLLATTSPDADIPVKGA
jgi:cystathionine beta-lyase/cystathionine gamma-synthase